MRAAVVLALAVAVAACSDDAGDAEREYDIVRNSGDWSEVCAAERKVADAHLRAKDEAKYREWDLRADISCRAADQRRARDPSN